MPISNADAMNFFKSLADENTTPLTTKFRPENDTSSYDAEFVARYADKNYLLCDMGSGTGLVINKIADKFGKIVCVEPFEEFSRFIERKDNIEIINAAIDDFHYSSTFDMITAFGFMQYFSETEAVRIYARFYKLLGPQGLLLVKNQFGIRATVTIDNYSEEMGRRYFSQYRTLGDECRLLSKAGFMTSLPMNITPDRFQRWPNTRFFALVCSKDRKVSIKF